MEVTLNRYFKHLKFIAQGECDLAFSAKSGYKMLFSSWRDKSFTYTLTKMDYVVQSITYRPVENEGTIGFLPAVSFIRGDDTPQRFDDTIQKIYRKTMQSVSRGADGITLVKETSNGKENA